MSCHPINVEFDIVTPDQLREIVLGLEKICVHDLGSWVVELELNERVSSEGQFTLVAKIRVPVPSDNAAATQGAETIARDGLCETQSAQTLVAAEELKSHVVGNATESDVQAAVLGILLD